MNKNGQKRVQMTPNWPPRGPPPGTPPHFADFNTKVAIRTPFRRVPPSESLIFKILPPGNQNVLAGTPFLDPFPQ